MHTEDIAPVAAHGPAARMGEARMTPPKIQALGITQEWFGTSWKATGYVEGIGWLTAWGPSLPAALEALQTLATQRVARVSEVMEDQDEAS
jgi:hypothetical protein